MPSTPTAIRSGLPSLRNKRGPRRDSSTFDTEDIGDSLDVATGPDEEDNGDDGEYTPGANIGYRKGDDETPLEARIERVFYINPYGQEIFPAANPEFLDTIAKRDVLVFSCGSLFTSIIPCLALRGLATAIATSSSLRAKVLLREYGKHHPLPLSR